MQAEMLDSAITNSLQLFADKGFKIRVIMRCYDPWFVAKDACDCLELTNVSKACQTLDEDEKGITKVYTLGGYQDMMLISESGLYRILAKCNLPKCEPFESWVFDEMAETHKTSPDTIREILRLACVELRNAHSEHAFHMDGESSDYISA